MMMLMDDLVAAIADLKREDLETWIQVDLITPDEAAGAPAFSELECARVQLICTLHYDMDVDVAVLPVILELLDQLHETRHRLRSLSTAVLAQDEDVRSAVLAVLAAR